jgi:hypothetical protein
MGNILNNINNNHIAMNRFGIIEKIFKFFLFCFIDLLHLKCS